MLGLLSSFSTTDRIVMPSKAQSRHEWLRPALAIAGHRQTDLAKEWGVDDAVVSRFLKAGEPKLIFERAVTLARMLNMPLEELQARLAENLPPQHSRPSPGQSQATAMVEGVQHILDELSECVE